VDDLRRWNCRSVYIVFLFCEFTKYVLGTTNYVFFSSDGTSWNSQSVTAQLCFDPVSNTILGLNGTVFLTRDYTQFTALPLPDVPKTSSFTSAAYDSVNQIVYVTCSWYKGFLQQGVVYSRSLTNTTWNSVKLPYTIVYTMGQSAFGNGVIVVQGNGFDGTRMYSSKDGTNFEQTIFLNSLICSLSFCGPTGSQRFFVACGIVSAYTSVDGYTWQLIQGDAALSFGISYSDTLGYVAGLFGNYSVSSDGINFVAGAAVTPTKTPFTDLACSGQNCVLVSTFENSIFVSSQ